MGLGGKVAIVTGSGRGIGRGIILKLAEKGAAVVVNAIGEDSMNDTLRMLKDEGRKAIGVRADVTKKDEVEKMMEATVKEFGRLDILVNNAGISRDAMLWQMTEQQWDEVIAVHLKGAFLCTQAACKFMRENKYGRIINISSEGALIGNPGMVNYISAKAGLFGFTMAVAKELAMWAKKEGCNITCNLLMPGYNETRVLASVPEKIKEGFKAAIPLGRISNAREDIGNAVAFLASEEASYITGVKFSVGGGLYMCLSS